MVYIDNFNAPFGNMIMCHMVADTTHELIEMVNKIGVNKKWIQDAGTYSEHFDICLSKKIKGLRFGAREIHFKDYANICKAKKNGWPISTINFLPVNPQMEIF